MKKIIKICKIKLKYKENHQILKIPFENIENLKKYRIPLENHENYEIIRIANARITKIMKVIEFH